MKFQLPPYLSRQAQQGYTLLELLLYVTLIGSLLTTVTFFFATVTEARIKNQSIQEVNDQGTALMDTLTQTIRNATSISSPTIGTSASSLTLVVPTGALSPTVFNLNNAILGYPTAGISTDTGDSNTMDATKFVASTSGNISTLYAMVGATIAASPNNKAQMAIYSGATTPTALLASSASTTITPSSWTAFTIPTVAVTSGQTYWLAYNSNGLSTSDNNLVYHPGTTGQSTWLAQTFGTWPASWTGPTQAFEFSMYAPIVTSAAPTTVQIKEGTGALVALTNDDVQVSGLTFKNLSLASTPGTIQISFTLSRVNPNNLNVFDYQRTFVGSAEVAW